PDKADLSRQKVDAALFLPENAKQRKSFDDSRPHWALQRLSIEFKKHRTEDDPEVFKTAYEPPADRRAATRGQIISYAKMLFSRQHRCFAFTILILRDFARIIRWDRAGTVITNKFKYTNTEYLGKFLWRFCNMTDKQQGYDTTAVAVKPGSADYKLMEQLAKNPPKGAGSEYARQSFARSMPNLSKGNPDDWSCWKLTVHPEKGRATSGSDPRRAGRDARKKPRSRYFLVGKPHFQASGMTGRATRGYIAYDCQGEKFVFLKDVWRVDLPDIEKEGYIVQSLNDAEVANVPTMVCHGDILEVEDDGNAVRIERQQTKTDTYWHESCSGQMNPIKAHTHYRLVVAEVCRPLSDFENALQLVRIISDCIFAHQQAMMKSGIIHRDVSAGNILMDEKLIDLENGEKEVVRVGVLCDWELSKPNNDENDEDGDSDDSEKRGTDKGSQKVRQPDRTGTWQFMSAILLDRPTRPVEVADELEAFFNVLLFYLIRYTNSNIDDPAAFMSEYFDECTMNAARTLYTCSMAKRFTMK
ncbi:hypothetical protein BKA93DRAFT_702813, partial [Sparassis latifolia]